MIRKSDFKKISDYLWEIPKTFRADMKVGALVFASEKLLEEAFLDRSLEQLINVATLPGIQKYALVMPDVHEGYGFPIGGVAAMDAEDGAISPGGIGFDINCGVRLLTSLVTFDKFLPKSQTIASSFYEKVPSGVGASKLKLDLHTLDTVLEKGAGWAVEQGYGEKEDLNLSESQGVLENANPTLISDHAKDRGKDQLGTMGSGNHFVEASMVSEIYDQAVAQAFGLFQNQMVIMIHCGSRGLGHQVATDYIGLILKSLPRYKIDLVDRELACAPISSREGENYFKAAAAAANFAWANRQIITWAIRGVWQDMFGKKENLRLLYDVSHNIAKFEDHEVDGKLRKLLVHRKGATRSFPPGHPELPAAYEKVGQPVIIPGSMGSASYVCVGTSKALKTSFGSSCHGAGRRMSRHKAKEVTSGRSLKDELEQKGIVVRCGSIAGLPEEAPYAYKDIDQVIESLTGVGIAKKVARLKPVVVVKG